MKNGFDLMIESLDMKIQVLRDIQEYNELQKKAFEQENPDMASFDSAIEKKTELIDRLEKLDDGFGALYSRLAEDIKENKAKYSSEIKTIQNKIGIVTELGIEVQASERRNKSMIESFFNRNRQNIQKGRVGSKVAYDYYKNMSGTSAYTSQFMDSKN